MASIDQLIRDHRLAQIGNGSAAAAMVVYFGLEFVAGRLTRHQLVEALVASDLLSHQGATRLATSYVQALRTAHGVGGQIAAPAFDAGASLGRAVGLLRDLDRAGDRVIDRSPELRRAMNRFGRTGLQSVDRNWDDEYRRIVEQFGVTADRHAKNAGRDTVAASAAASGRRWRRVSDGNPCSFCAMMIGRGPVYTSAEAARSVVGRRGKPRGARGLAEKYHNNCGCTVVEVIGTWTPTADEQRYVDLYADATEALAAEGVPATTENVLSKMRELGDGILNDAHVPKPQTGGAAGGGSPPGRGAGPFKQMGDPPPESDREAWLAYWKERQDALPLDFQGDTISPQEVQGYERLLRAGQDVAPIWNDPSRPTSDFNWLNLHVDDVEMKASRNPLREIETAARKAVNHPWASTTKERFLIDLGEHPLTDELRATFGQYNAGRRKYRISRLWVMHTDGLIEEIPLAP